MLLHRFFIRDTSVLEVNDFQPNTGIEIYEVIRVMDGIPLFLEDHLRRFHHSAWLCHLEIPLDDEMIRALLLKLTEVNGVYDGNVRFSYCFRPVGTFHAYFIPHSYPGGEMISQGVSCGLLRAERSGPNAKTVQAGLRGNADRMIGEHGFYEVLLVNRRGEITEGSRSNVFFLKDEFFFTSPSEDVLPGITRQKVLDLISEAGMKIMMKSIFCDELAQVEAAFLTGTSPKVLPIRKAGDFQLTVGHPAIKQLLTEYDAMIDDYIKRNR